MEQSTMSRSKILQVKMVKLWKKGNVYCDFFLFLFGSFHFLDSSTLRFNPLLLMTKLDSFSFSAKSMNSFCEGHSDIFYNWFHDLHIRRFKLVCKNVFFNQPFWNHCFINHFNREKELNKTKSGKSHQDLIHYCIVDMKLMIYWCLSLHSFSSLSSLKWQKSIYFSSFSSPFSENTLFSSFSSFSSLSSPCGHHVKVYKSMYTELF